MQHWALTGKGELIQNKMIGNYKKADPFKLHASLRALAESFSEGTFDSEENDLDTASYMTLARL